VALLPLGTAILGRYVLIGAIGQGGVSTVYSAVDARRGRRIAVKILAPAQPGSTQARDDARREALITDRLRHPSVPRVFEYGEAPLPDGTVVPYVVLELLDGVPLMDRLAAGALHWREAVRIAATVADVLAVAHRRGVVHRDLAPRNIMVTPDGIKIIDFGMATAAVRNGDTGTRPIVVRSGARRDRAPSHPKTAFASPADDVYTLGVLLYEMLTGVSPYPPGIAATILAAGRSGHLAPTPVLTVPGLPAAVRHLVRACMAKRPADRPRSPDAALALWKLLDPPSPPARPPHDARNAGPEHPLAGNRSCTRAGRAAGARSE
jgi:serine/threonine protein kinase